MKRIIKKVRKSCKLSDLLEEWNKLEIANQTRWNSNLKMLRSILKLPEDVLQTLEPKLSAHEVNLIKEIVDCLEPFEMATDMLQGDGVTSSSVIISISGIKFQLDELSNMYKNKMLTAFKSSMDARMTKYEDHSLFIKATILDPQNRLEWCNQEEKGKYRDLIQQELQAITPQATAAPRDEAASRPRKKSKLCAFMSAPAPAPQQTNQLDKYLQDASDPDADPLSFWRQHQQDFPQLTQLAVKYLGVPASSAPVERLFSIAGKVLRPDRCRLKDSTFEQLMFIKCNSTVL